MPRLSVTVITLNEARHIAECLASVAFADERLVVDSGSTDGTADLARAAGARVIVRDWPGYAAQKNVAAGDAQHDWILSIDADERVTPELAAEIQTVMKAEPAEAGFRIPRVAFHLGRWIRVTDWYPDYQLRLYDRRRARWAPRKVHESVTADGSVGKLRCELRHYAYRDVSHHIQTIDRYTTLAAQQMVADGKHVNMLDLALHPPAAFVRNYILKGGWRAGTTGFIISVLNSYYVLVKLTKLWAIQQKNDKNPRS